MTFAKNKKDYAQKLDVKQLPHPRDGRPEWALRHWWLRNIEAFRAGGLGWMSVEVMRWDWSDIFYSLPSPHKSIIQYFTPATVV